MSASTSYALNGATFAIVSLNDFSLGKESVAAKWCRDLEEYLW